MALGGIDEGASPRPGDRPLRLLHLAHTTDRRGAEVFATTLSRRLADLGHDSEAVALVGGGPGGLPLESLGKHGRTPLALAKLRRRLDDRDLLVCYGASTLLAGAVTTLAGPPMIYRSIGDPRVWGAVRARDLRIGRPLRRAAQVVALWPESAVALTELHRLDPARVHVIPNGRDATHFRPASADERTSARSELGIPIDAHAVAYVGSLDRDKRPLAAIEAVLRLPDTHVLVAGDGPLRDAVRAAADADPRVHPLGSVPDPRTVYRAVDALVQASRTEGLPGVVIEAALSGVPSVATDVGGTATLVDERTGALVPSSGTLDDPDLVDHLEDALARVLADAPSRGAAARERCLREHTLERVVGRWDGLIRQTAAESEERPTPAARRATQAATAAATAPPVVRSLHLSATTRRRGAEVFAHDLVVALRRTGQVATERALYPGEVEPELPVDVLGPRRVATRSMVSIRRFAADQVVVAHGADTLLATSAALAGRRAAWVYRSIGDPAYWGRVPAARWRVGTPLRQASMVVTLWRAAADDLIARYHLDPARLAVITNAVPAERFPRRHERAVAEARQALSLGDGPVLAHVGSLSEEKDPAAAIRVAAAVPHATLLVAGAGPLRRSLEDEAHRLAPGRVRFLGQVEHTAPVLTAADCLLITSRTEGVPAVAIEAGLTGIPVVSTAVGGVGEVVIDHETGRLVPPGDDAALVRAVIDAVARGEELGDGGHERCSSQFTMDRVATDWAALLASLAAAR